jgi:hypothetical protein
MRRLAILLFILCYCYITAEAQGDSTTQDFLSPFLTSFSLSGYGAMNYYNFDWQTDSAKRNAIDNERFILEMAYHWTHKLRLNAELEIEHGGTGSAVEFDRFEEFGEFEYEIEKGGEVLLEQMNLDFALSTNSRLKIGRVKVPFGMMYAHDEPTEYLTATQSEMEIQLLPENWTDNGILWTSSLGRRKRLRYALSLTNGLDGSAFSSANWIKRGNQTRFEMVNAENFALTARVDYMFNSQLRVGASVYAGNSTGNRPKPDLAVSTPVIISEGHLDANFGALSIKGMAMYGTIGNSEALSNQNRNLSNNLNVKRTPVGAAALGAYLEAGVNITGSEGIFPTIRKESWVYGRYDYYDSMFRTQGQIFNNPRWERQSATVGVVFKFIDQVHIKAQYSIRKVGAPAPSSINGGTLEKTITGGFAFEFN